MNMDASILKEVRIALDVGEDITDFDDELLMHINSAIGKLNQNGVGNFLVVNDENSKWSDLQDVTQTEGNKYFQMVPLFITLSTKLLFDPPPPSNVQYHSQSVNELLWRLKIAYEEPYVAPIVDSNA